MHPLSESPYCLQLAQQNHTQLNMESSKIVQRNGKKKGMKKSVFQFQFSTLEKEMHL